VVERRKGTAMTVLSIIVLIFLVLNLFFYLAYIYIKNKHIEIMEKQNKLLWAAVEQSKALMAESLKELQKTQAELKGVTVHVDGKEIYKAVNETKNRRKPQ
jgi:F0F1-type ATP synthase membrane subunit b/b'